MFANPPEFASSLFKNVVTFEKIMFKKRKVHHSNRTDLNRSNPVFFDEKFHHCRERGKKLKKIQGFFGKFGCLVLKKRIFASFFRKISRFLIL